MSAKKLPSSVLRIDTRFADKVEKFCAGWKGAKPSAKDSWNVATVALGSVWGLAPFNYLRRDYAGRPTLPFANEPRTPAEDWLRVFLQHPDFTLALMAHARKHVKKYDTLDRVLSRLSAENLLGSISDGDLLVEVRKKGVKPSEVSDDKIKKRRQRWTNAQLERDGKA